MMRNKGFSWETENRWKVIEIGMIMKMEVHGITNNKLNFISERLPETANNSRNLSQSIKQTSCNPKACMIAPSSKISTLITF